MPAFKRDFIQLGRVGVLFFGQKEWQQDLVQLGMLRDLGVESIGDAAIKVEVDATAGRGVTMRRGAGANQTYRHTDFMRPEIGTRRKNQDLEVTW